MIKVTRIRSFIATLFVSALLAVFIGFVAALFGVRVPVISNIMGR